MFILLLIPAAIAVWWMQQHTSASTLVNVYIPALFLFPLYFELKLKGLPPVNDAQAVMIVFAAFILLRHRHELYFSTTDIWVCFGVYGLMLSETFRTGLNNGIFELASDTCSASSALPLRQALHRAVRPAHRHAQAHLLAAGPRRHRLAL